MTDPATLRAQATQLRAAARTMRSQATDLAQGVANVTSHYPSGASGVWGGPSADTFYTALSDAKGQLASLVTDVDDYAGACERKATALDSQADAAAKNPPH